MRHVACDGVVATPRKRKRVQSKFFAPALVLGEFHVLARPPPSIEVANFAFRSAEEADRNADPKLPLNATPAKAGVFFYIFAVAACSFAAEAGNKW
jgi:hypothetical protein